MVPLFLCYSLPLLFLLADRYRVLFQSSLPASSDDLSTFNLSSIPNIVIDEFPTSKRYLDLIPHREGNESFSKRAQNQADRKEYATKQFQNRRTHEVRTGTNPFLLEEGYTHSGKTNR